MRYVIIDHETEKPMRVVGTRREAADAVLTTAADMADYHPATRERQLETDRNMLRAFVEGSRSWAYTSRGTVRPIEG